MSKLDNPNFTFEYTTLDQILRELKNLSISIDHISVKIKGKNNTVAFFINPHPATRHRRNVVTTSLCTSQRRRRYVSNETPNDVSMERHQDVSVVRLRDILLERRDDVSRGRNNEALSVRLHDFSNKSQMKHPTTSHWYVPKTSQGHLSTTSHEYVPTTSPVSLK